MERTYGVEIEMYSQEHDVEAVLHALRFSGVDVRREGYNHNDEIHQDGNNGYGQIRTWWKIVPDGSLHSLPNPMELVSPILHGEDGIEQLRKVCTVLEQLGMRNSKSTGLHVHIGAGDMTVEQVKNIVARYAKYERQIDSIMPRSRRANNNRLYCRTLLNGEAARIQSAVADSVHTLTYATTDRMFKINLRSYRKYRTIEIRHHSGSVNFEKISNWVRFLQAFVKRTIDLTNGNGTSTVTVVGRGPRPGSMKAQIMDMIREGLTVREISIRLGKTDPYVIWQVRQITRDHGGEITVHGKRTDVTRRFVIHRELGNVVSNEDGNADSSPWEGVPVSVQEYINRRIASFRSVESEA